MDFNVGSQVRVCAMKLETETHVLAQDGALQNSLPATWRAWVGLTHESGVQECFGRVGGRIGLFPQSPSVDRRRVRACRQG